MADLVKTKEPLKGSIFVAIEFRDITGRTRVYSRYATDDIVQYLEVLKSLKQKEDEFNARCRNKIVFGIPQSRIDKIQKEVDSLQGGPHHRRMLRASSGYYEVSMPVIALDDLLDFASDCRGIDIHCANSTKPIEACGSQVDDVIKNYFNEVIKQRIRLN